MRQLDRRITLSTHLKFIHSHLPAIGKLEPTKSGFIAESVGKKAVEDG